MNINAEFSPKNCAACGHTKMRIEGVMKCPNCSTANEPKTGHTIIVTEPNGKDGPVVIQRLNLEEQRLLEAKQILELRKKTEAEAKGMPGIAAQEEMTTSKAGTVTIHVPTNLFPDLVMWARKLKVPKDWKEAEKIKAITDFQIEINSKLGGLK